MNEWNQWENQLRSWTPRAPSARLKERLFPGANAAARQEFYAGPQWAWLAPVTACFLMLTVLTHPRTGGWSELSAEHGRDWMTLIASNQSYAAYIDSDFHSEQNALKGEPIEWRTGTTSERVARPILAGKTNNLIR